MAEIPEPLQSRGLGVGVSRPEDIAHLSGLEIVAAMGEGRLPVPPICASVPHVPQAWSEGEVEFRAWPEQRFYNPIGSVHAGWAMTLLDSAMAVAALTTLAAGETHTTLDTAVRFVRPVFADTGELRAIGRVIARGRRVITLEGWLDDLEGRRFAHGSSSCLVMARPGRD